MKKQLLIYSFLILFLTITACDDKKSNQKRYFDWNETQNEFKEMERLLVGKWKISNIMEEDGLEVIFKITDDYRSNNEYYSEGTMEIQNNTFFYSMKGTWELKGSNLYTTCEKLAGSITNVMPQFNCDYVNMQPPTELIKIDNKELQFSEEGKTMIAYRIE